MDFCFIVKDMQRDLQQLQVFQNASYDKKHA
jgi:hypothetical protein